jgi:hypothetical protein
MSLLREIQTVVTSKDGDVIFARHMCKILSARLHSEELARWVDFELDGFPMSQPVLEYRQLSVSCLANFRNLAWRATDQPVARFAVPENIAEAVFSPIEFRRGSPISLSNRTRKTAHPGANRFGGNESRQSDLDIAGPSFRGDV